MIIGTHNGTFHCDEVCAVWMLKQLPKYKDAKVVRSRSSDILADCDIVVDVGAVFDHSNVGMITIKKSLQKPSQS
ncbi:C12orf10 [Bugula neritina]|uniref:C12orf10 n=1 Tax=Bugula neritina TaxID=10212 RepID=A0A7J7IYY8_BUGNE|nr:C12orf10 [Bugula neritina]